MTITMKTLELVNCHPRLLQRLPSAKCRYGTLNEQNHVQCGESDCYLRRNCVMIVSVTVYETEHMHSSALTACAETLEMLTVDCMESICGKNTVVPVENFCGPPLVCCYTVMKTFLVFVLVWLVQLLLAWVIMIL